MIVWNFKQRTHNLLNPFQSRPTYILGGFWCIMGVIKRGYIMSFIFKLVSDIWCALSKSEYSLLKVLMSLLSVVVSSCALRYTNKTFRMNRTKTQLDRMPLLDIEVLNNWSYPNIDGLILHELSFKMGYPNKYVEALDIDNLVIVNNVSNYPAMNVSIEMIFNSKYTQFEYFKKEELKVLEIEGAISENNELVLRTGATYLGPGKSIKKVNLHWKSLITKLMWNLSNKDVGIKNYETKVKTIITWKDIEGFKYKYEIELKLQLWNAKEKRIILDEDEKGDSVLVTTDILHIKFVNPHLEKKRKF